MFHVALDSYWPDALEHLRNVDADAFLASGLLAWLTVSIHALLLCLAHTCSRAAPQRAAATVRWLTMLPAADVATLSADCGIRLRLASKWSAASSSLRPRSTR